MGIFSDKVVVITGAGRGIGRSHALAFAREGAKVVINDLGTDLDGFGSTAQIADKVVEEIKSLGGKAVANYNSVTTMEGSRNIIQTALDNYGKVDVLINNAGILRDKSFLKMEEEMWDKVIAVHLKGTFSCTQAAARIMREQGTGGSIINTTSIAGIIGNFGQCNYAAAKAGIIGFTKTIAIELERYNINVNCIAPLAMTRMKSPIVADYMTPGTVTPMVLFLASDKARTITGHILGIHGYNLFEYQVNYTNGVERSAEDPWTIDDIAENFEAITQMS